MTAGVELHALSEWIGGVENHQRQRRNLISDDLAAGRVKHVPPAGPEKTHAILNEPTSNLNPNLPKPKILPSFTDRLIDYMIKLCDNLLKLRKYSKK